MKKTILIVSILLFFLIQSNIFALKSGISLNMQFYNKEIYYPDSTVQLRLIIKNESDSPYSFKLSDNRVFSLQINGYTLRNQKIKLADNYTHTRSQNLPVLYREITIKPGEEFSFFVRLNDFLSRMEAGMYILEAVFFPELYYPSFFSDSEKTFLSSPRLSLSIRPGSSEKGQDFTQKESFLKMEEEMEEIQQKADLPPDKVVETVLQARQKEQWPLFFLYLDIEEIMRLDPDIDKEFNSLSEQEKELRIEKFKAEMMQKSLTDKGISINLRPVEFQLKKLETSYLKQEARVLVDQYFRYPDFIEHKEFTYFLHRKNNIWKIYRYYVKNIGTR